MNEIKSVIGDQAGSLPQAALKFILAHPAICSVIPGMMDPAQIDDGVATSKAAALSESVLERLRNI